MREGKRKEEERKKKGRGKDEDGKIGKDQFQGALFQVFKIHS